MPRCLYDDESFADFDRRWQPRRDGLPGREVACERCGGYWSIKDGGRPVECKRNRDRVDAGR